MTNIVHNNTDQLFQQVSHLIAEARSYVAKTVNSAMVTTYYEIGRHIVENEQNGQERAQYGKQVLPELSARLTAEFGKGWSVETLKKCRVLYKTYAPEIGSTVQTESNLVHSVDQIQLPHLSWNHLQILMRIEDAQARHFYEVESQQQNWSVRQLQRQVASSLYERLALSRDKDEVMRLAQEGQVVAKPADIIKDPLVLEFVGLKPDSSYSESNDALVELTLPKEANIYAQQYMLCLPNKEVLQAKLREWIQEAEK